VEQYYRRALNIYVKEFGEDDPNRTTYMYIVQVYIDTNSLGQQTIKGQELLQLRVLLLKVR